MNGAYALDALLAPFGVNAPATVISGLTLDSREVTGGDAFLAVRGSQGHGARYVEQALTRGAAAVLCEPQEGLDGDGLAALCRAAGVSLVEVPRLRERAGPIAARFFDEPARRMRVVGVTGTDGKTSTAQFLARALDEPGHPWAVIGTLGWGRPDALRPATHTTPDAVSLQAQLAALVADGVQGVVMEVSSHALDQRRTAGVPIAVAVLTNLSRDHLDYHGSEEAYAAAKARLFTDPPPGTAVVNWDDAFGRRLAEFSSAPVIGYALEDTAARVRASHLRPQRDGLRLRVSLDGHCGEVRVPLFGRFNAANVLATAAAMHALGQDREAVMAGLARLRPVPGRMEPLGGGVAPTVLIDYAHTPAALEAALEAARAHFPGRLICVVGCGGERDRGKRPLMARAAERHADEVVLTSDNPRGESPTVILEDMAAGLTGASAGRRIDDRREAIAAAVTAAAVGDVVLLAGKGHEPYQEAQGRRLVFCDRDEAEAALGLAGPQGEGAWSR